MVLEDDMQSRKRKVADIALKLFIEKGIQHTSIQEIIEKANISKGTFYNYFSSKNDCIANILEALRYDARQQRMALQMGKDTKDRDIFIEQITIILRLNEERNLHAIFENILYSNELELKKLVLQHRMIEIEWLSNRFIEIMGEEIREYAFEGTVLFYGMMHYMLFTLRVTNSQYSFHQLVDVILSYIETIIPKMITNGRPIINNAAIDLLRSNIDRKVVTKTELLDLSERLSKDFPFSEEQQDLFDAIVSELHRDRIRKTVLQSLLKPFYRLFTETLIESQVQNFTNLVWYYLNSIK